MTSRLLAVVALLLCAAAAAGQYAPEGNAHPHEPMVHDDQNGLLPLPFGEPEMTLARMSGSPEQVRAKIEFARQVDLSPLRSLAVQHGGRVKILDTLARETVGTISGQRRFVERLDARDEQPALRHAFDPVFTLLDLVIDPAHYANRPLVHVDYLRLREELIRREIPIPADADAAQVRSMEATRERLSRSTRMAPLTIVRHIQDVQEAYAFNEPYLNAISDVHRALSLWERSGGNFLMVAPTHIDAPWLHFRAHDYPRAAEVHALADRLGRSWRAGDAATVNQTIAELASILPTIHAEVYPDSRRDLELAYNRMNAFTWGYWLYLAAFVGLLVGMGTGRRTILAIGMTLLLAAVTMHALGFSARCVIAQRWAIQNQFESMIGVSLFGSIVGLGIMAWRRQRVFAAAAAAMGFMVLIIATEARIPGQTIGREAAILNTSVLLKYHVTTVLTSYGLISLGFVLSVFYLALHYGSRVRSALATGTSLDPSPPPPPSRTLRDLDRANIIVLQLAFWTLAVGILLGAWWADHSWGRFWAWDPKEAWALATWIIYLIVIHVRLITRRRELITAWLSILGFGVMLWTYFGVNLLLSGLHSYA